MWIDGTKYYFKLGDKSPIILELKKFLDSRPEVKAKNNRSPVFDARLQASLIEYQTH